MFQYQCLNPISKVGLDGFTNDYTKTEEIEKADAILVRSASMHEMKLPENKAETETNFEVVKRLKAIKEELLQIKDQLQ